MVSEMHPHNQGRIGLVLSGGGARGAYQAGVLRAIAEIRDETQGCRPLSVITGVSAGAINAACLAADPRPELDAAIHLTNLWSSITSDQVFKTDALSIGRIGWKWLRDTALGTFSNSTQARSLLDTTPLRGLLARHIDFSHLPKRITDGSLEALAITALHYASAHNISFIQGREDLPVWYRARRRGEKRIMAIEHVLASSAIPLFFPPVRVGDDYFGDGCLRNSAPLSPAIHLGADRLIVISVRRPDSRAAPAEPDLEPSIARVLGVMLNALLMDAVEFDMERLSRINATLDHIPTQVSGELSLRKIDYLWLRPSEDIGHMAAGQFNHLPSVIRYLIGGLGSSREASELTSYLLFDPEYCGKLVDLGYQDGRAQAAEIKKFLTT